MDRVLDENPVGRRRAELELHLEACPRCRCQWQALQAAETALRTPQAAPVPDGLLSDFRRRLAEEENLPSRPASFPPASQQDRRGWLRWIWPAGSVAAAGMAAALAVSFNLQSVFQEPPHPLSPPRVETPRGETNPAETAVRDRRYRHAGDRGKKGSDHSLLAKSGQMPTPNRKAAGSAGGGAQPSRTAAGAPNGTRAPAAKHAEKRLARPETLNFRAGHPAPGSQAQRSITARDESRTSIAGDQLERLSRSKMSPQAPLTDTPREPERGNTRLTEKPGTALARNRSAGEPLSQMAAVAEDRERSLNRFYVTPGNPTAGPAKIRAEYLDFQASRASRQDLVELGLETEALAVQAKELEVSPAVLTALQRPVEVSLRNETIQEAARQLTEAADVVLKIDPRIAGVSVNFAKPATRTPLWIVLQEVAQQNQLQILPQENQLLLKPAAQLLPKAAKTPAGAVGVFAGGFAGVSPGNPRAGAVADSKKTEEAKPKPAALPTAAPLPAPQPSAPQPTTPGPAGPAGSVRKALRPRNLNRPNPAPIREELAEKQGERDLLQPKRSSIYVGSRILDLSGARGVGVLPDRQVWPTDWGFLPERGFTIPPPETLPPSPPPRNAAKAAKGGNKANRAVPAQSPTRKPAAKKPVKKQRKAH